MAQLLNMSARLAALAAGGLMGLYFAGSALGAGPVTTLAVEARAVPLNSADPAADRVGRLRYLGGLRLTAADMRFGGLSGLLWQPGCNRLLAVSDAGSWVILEPQEEGERLVGIRAGWIAPVRDQEGREPLSKRRADAESLARTDDGAAWVFYEQDHRAERHPGISACNPESLATPADQRWQPPGSQGWPPNGGLEAAAASGDRLVAITEAVPGATGGRLGLAARPGGTPIWFDWPAPSGFQPTAMEPLGVPSGTMLVLHRRFSPFTGVAAILSEGELPPRPGAPVNAREIARLAPPFSVDNMEALAVRAEGERRFVYLLSDDNFNPLQQTILLKFELMPPAAAGE